MPGELEKIAKLKRIHQNNYGDDDKSTKSKVKSKGEWFGTRVNTSKLASLGNSIFGMDNHEICSTYEILILPADGKKIINQDNTVTTELTAIF